MKFTIEREALLKPLQLVSGVIERRHQNPILSNTLMTVQAQRLSFITTDLDLELLGQVELSASSEPGSTTFGVKKLVDICRSLPEKAILEFSVNNQLVNIKSGRSRFTLATLPASDFPIIDDPLVRNEFLIRSSDLRYLLERTYFAMAQQDVRYFLNGASWLIDKQTIKSVATDGHRLALTSLPIDSPINDEQIIIPRKAVVELMRLVSNYTHIDDVRVKLGAHHLRIISPDYTLTTKLIEGRFPNVDKVIPRGGDKEILLHRESLKQALYRVAILANEKVRGVCLQLRTSILRVIATNSTQETAEEVFEINYTGADLDIGFNVGYLLDALNALSSETVKFTFLNANSSILIEDVSDSSSLYVVMPMLL